MRLRHGLLATWLLVSVGACSGKDEAEEPVEEGKEGEADADKAAEPPPAEDAPADATPAAEPVPEAAAPAPEPAEPAGFEGPTVTKYVTSFALNVRTGPGKEFPIKRHVKRGDKIDVVINGEWAKLGTGEYVSVNRLADQAPANKKKK